MPDTPWTWCRSVLVHPAGNVDAADTAGRYRSLLAEPTSFEAVTIEDLLDAGALPKATRTTLADRYIAT